MLKKLKMFLFKKYRKQYIKFENGEFKTIKQEENSLSQEVKTNKDMEINLNKDDDNTNLNFLEKNKSIVVKILIIFFIATFVYVGSDIYKNFINPQQVNNKQPQKTNTGQIVKNEKEANKETIKNKEQNKNHQQNVIEYNLQMATILNDLNNTHTDYINAFVNIDNEIINSIKEIKILTNNYINLQMNLPLYYSKIERIKNNQEAITQAINSNNELLNILTKRLHNTINMCNNILDVLNKNKGDSYLNKVVSTHILNEINYKQEQNKIFIEYLKENKIKFTINKENNSIVINN